jgi:hypothetical protein
MLYKMVLVMFLTASVLESCLLPMDKRYPLTIKNNGPFTITYLVAPFGIGPVYPDTSVPLSNVNFRPVAATSSAINYLSVPWRDVFAKLPLNTLSLYIAHPDTIAKYPWDTIKATYNILQRYDINAQDFEHRGGVFEYPYDSTLGKLKVFRK